jgi:hypothetical protein
VSLACIQDPELDYSFFNPRGGQFVELEFFFSQYEMAPSILGPMTNYFSGYSTVGVVYARYLLTAFVFFILFYTFCHAWRAKRALHLLDEAEKIRQLKAASGDEGRDQKQVVEYWR